MPCHSVPMRLGLLLLLVCHAGVTSGQSPPTNPSSLSGQRALETLLGTEGHGLAGSVTAQSLASVSEVTVQRGENLDALLRRTLAHLPFKEVFLRQVLIELNPHAFQNGSPHRMVAGARLVVPSVPELMRRLEQQLGMPPRQPPQVVVEEVLVPHGQPVSASGDRNRWVRFP